MKRRDILKNALLLAGSAGAATSLATPALAQSMPEVKWRMTSSFPKSLEVLYGGTVVFAKMVSDLTDGKFQIQTFAAGEIVPGLQALDAASNGAVECAQTPVYFYFGKDPTLSFGTGIPFGLNARQQYAWWHHGGGDAIINASLAKFGVTGFIAGNSGCQMGGFFRKELKDVEDLKGLKFRIGGIGGQVLAKLGVVPQQIAAGDVYPALERGTLDAAEFVGPFDDEKLGFHRIAKYYYYPGWWEGGAAMHHVVNTTKWNELPKLYQNAFKNACEAMNAWMVGKYDAENAQALRRLVAAGTELRPFPQPIMDASLAAAKELYVEIAGRSPDFKKALDSASAFRSTQLDWWQVAELTYDSFMVRNRAKL
jgi:TRAP-type mannitol/chloroaromatic compound transport system substrate-binding protein